MQWLRVSGKSIKKRLTSSSTRDDFPAPPVPVIPRIGILTFFDKTSLSSTLLINAQPYNAYKDGEWLRFKISYSGWLKAGEATLDLSSDVDNYIVKAVGKSTGPLKWFFKVEDFYESNFSKKTGLPRLFKRKINEGGHTKNLTIEFDQNLKIWMKISVHKYLPGLTAHLIDYHTQSNSFD